MTSNTDQDFYEKFVKWPGFDRIPASHEHVAKFLIDWTVATGPVIVVQELQRVLMIETTGKLDADTLQLLTDAHPYETNNRLVAARLRQVGRILANRPEQAKLAGEWINRVVEFLL